MAAQHRRSWQEKAVPRYCIVSCLLLLALLIAGCVATGPRSHGDDVAPPVVLRNPTPSVLDVMMGVNFDRQPGDTDTRVDVVLSFLSQGHPVQFAGDERVTCDGMDLSLQNRVADFQVLQTSAAQAVGVIIHCEYGAGGVVAGISLQIPPAPEITSPQVGEQVVRSARTLVTYRCDSATCALLGVVALAGSPSSATHDKALAALNTPGPLQATVDTSGFAAGPGSLVLTASLAPRLTQTGASFKSTRVVGNATVGVAVTWV
jgi:hypothetical protein